MVVVCLLIIVRWLHGGHTESNMVLKQKNLSSAAAEASPAREILLCVQIEKIGFVMAFTSMSFPEILELLLLLELSLIFGIGFLKFCMTALGLGNTGL